MMKGLTLAIVGAGGLLLGVPEADAQDCRRAPRGYRSTGTFDNGYRHSDRRFSRYEREFTRFNRGVNVRVGVPGFSMSYPRAPRHYTSRHCGRCSPVRERVWVNQPRTQQVFAGYDRCGRPIYRTVCIRDGYFTTRTRFVCY